MENYYIADGVKHTFENKFLNLSSLNIKELIVVSYKIVKLDCNNNQLKKLELNTPNLKELYCYNNQLSKLELSTHNLITMYCFNNKLSKLELNIPNLKYLNCDDNQLKKLELNTPNLKELSCRNNKLKELELNILNLIILYTDSKITLNGNPNIIGIDGYIEEVVNERQIGDFYIYETIRGYVAKKDKFSSHGETLKQAIEDVNFKFLQETLDLDELVSEIKTKGTLNMSEYRLLTGACSQMSKKFCDEHNIGYSDEVSLDIALQIIKGNYGYEKFSEFFK